MRASGYERAASDWYVEPGWLVDALIAVEHPFDEVWDPCCGCGTIPLAMRKHDVRAWGTDVEDRGFGLRADFFATWQVPVTSSIVSNPPYHRAEEFVRHALPLATDRVCMLGRLAFLEGQARRDGLFKEHPPARVWVSSRRPSMPPGGSDVKASGGSIAFAWFVWDRAAQPGRPVIGWLP